MSQRKEVLLIKQPIINKPPFLKGGFLLFIRDKDYLTYQSRKVFLLISTFVVDNSQS